VTLAFAHVASHGLAALGTSWPVYALAIVGAGNVLLTQTAYQTGKPMITLPIIAAITPVASVAIGVGLLGETPGTGVAGAVTAGVALLVASLALARLAREAPHPEPVKSERVNHEPVNHEPVNDEQAGERLPVLTGACR
jgi:drug/metabolite transporter (DMT)-like permease